MYNIECFYFQNNGLDEKKCQLRKNEAEQCQLRRNKTEQCQLRKNEEEQCQLRKNETEQSQLRKYPPSNHELRQSIAILVHQHISARTVMKMVNHVCQNIL